MKGGGGSVREGYKKGLNSWKSAEERQGVSISPHPLNLSSYALRNPNSLNGGIRDRKGGSQTYSKQDLKEKPGYFNASIYIFGGMKNLY